MKSLLVWPLSLALGALPSVGSPVVAFEKAHAQVLGLDGTYSLPLRPGTSLWLFGDTLLGSWQGGLRHIQSMPPCTAAWGPDAEAGVGHGALSFFGGASPQQALVVQGRPQGRRHWPMAPFQAGARRFLAFVEIEAVGTGPYDFKVHGTGLAQTGTPSVQAPWGLPFRAKGLLWPGQEPSFGAGVLQEGPWTYLYSGGVQTHLARVPTASVGQPEAFRYWTGQAWALKASQARSLCGSGPEVGVRRAPRGQVGYWMLYVAPLGRQLMGRWAPRPEGPWGLAKALGQAIPEGDPEAIAYGAKWHPQLDRPGLVALSWNTNAPSEALPRRQDLYWPRIAWLPSTALGPPHGARGGPAASSQALGPRPAGAQLGFQLAWKAPCPR